MKLASFMLLAPMLCVRLPLAQSIDWQRIVNLPHPPHLVAEQLSTGQRHALEQAIVASNTVWDDCEFENDWPQKIEAHRVDLGTGHFTLAEAGVGCARGGQGANGAMWLLRWDGGKPVLLGNLDGWFDAVLPQTSSGLHDVAVGWHNSYAEYGLALYRFHGTRYRLIDSTTVRCQEGSERCVAVPRIKRRQATGEHRDQRRGAVATPTNESAQP